jgi:ketosteroid isomerase-like protein
MAHPNEELVRRGYEAFNTADVETLREVFADTTIFHEPGRSPISGDYQGLDQYSASSEPSSSGLAGPSGPPSMTW